MSMGRFDKYKGLFAGDGGFDIPSNYSIGIALAPLPAWNFALDLQRINYGEIASVGNPSAVQAPLGSAAGPGFGWRDIDVVKLGVAWRVSDAWTLRAGYNRGGNPITPADVTFNVVAPGVIKDHYTLGFTVAPSKAGELTMSLMVAPRQSVSGPSLFNPLMQNAAGNETIRMREVSVGAAWGYRF
jgi:long-chain fatty acid transport protein